MGVKKKRFAESALLHIVIVFITLLCVLPILWMCLIAVKPASESISGKPNGIHRCFRIRLIVCLRRFLEP